jgi:hypothetical protein
MKIDMGKLTKFQRWALVRMVSNRQKKNKAEIEEWYARCTNEGGLDFNLTSFGVEFDILEILDTMEKCMDEEVAKKAEELIDEKLGDAFNEVEEAIREAILTALKPFQWAKDKLSNLKKASTDD